MLYSGVLSTVEMDLKKVVALSTLRQLSFIFFSLSMGLKILRFIHLGLHAIFKSMLFLNVGVLIHCIFRSQDLRVWGSRF